MMEKAKFTGITKTKKGKLHGSVEFENGKKMPIPPQFELEESLNNKECELERKKGAIVRILVEGKELSVSVIKKTDKKRGRSAHAKSSGRQKQHGSRGRSNVTQGKGRAEATAPYNFISLDDTLVEAPEDPEQLKFDTYNHGDNNSSEANNRLSGHLECHLETITPLYIRDIDGLATEIKDYENGKSKDKKDNPNFFAPGGKIKIPGSSMRGMTRSLVEIMSWGKFAFFDDKTLYYRGLADKSSLRKEYQRNMSSYNQETRSSLYKFNAGYLVKKDFKYYIIPAKKINGKQFTQVKREETGRGRGEEFIFEKWADGRYLVISGEMPDKKKDWLINSPDYERKTISICEEDIDAYEKDENRFYDKKETDERKRKDGNLLRMLRVSQDEIVPCFYVRWQDKKGRNRVSFGHTGFFRLAYKKTVAEHVPPQLLNTEKIDLAEAIFGKESKFASRVFFEDAELLAGQEDVLLEEVSPKILASPKPTTFQHYLEQDDSVEPQELEHWNDAAFIRGHKLYWHRDTNVENLMHPHHWSEGEVKKTTQHTAIKAVKPATKFKGRIRFENLSERELGALLFALDLPENHYHKLGMGKPLGLGSVEIKTTLTLSARVERYKQLFTTLDDKISWTTAESKAGKEQIIFYKDHFAKYILSALASSNEKETVNKGTVSKETTTSIKTLWQEIRMKQLQAILDWGNNKKSGWLEKTKYLELGEFRDRRILPNPEKVIN